MKLSNWHIAALAIFCFLLGMWSGSGGMFQRPTRHPAKQAIVPPAPFSECQPCANNGSAVASARKPLAFTKAGCTGHTKQLGHPDYGYWTLCVAGLNSESVVFSFGIGEDMSFDEDVMKKFKSRVFGFDPTPKSKRFVEKQDRGPLWTYRDVGLADHDTTLTLHMPANQNHVSASVSAHALTGSDVIKVPALSLKTAMREAGVPVIDVLKMDVEGAEWAIFDALARDNFWPTNQLLMEFHARFTPDGAQKAARAMDLIENAGFTLVHDTGTEEYTWIRFSDHHRRRSDPVTGAAVAAAVPAAVWCTLALSVWRALRG